MKLFVFPRWANKTRQLAGVALGVTPVYLTAFIWYGFSPKTTDVGYMPQQPVPYSHALHVGELLYGNLGSARRLDFTVLGSAVNEASRIESLCGSLDQTIIVSQAFAEAGGDAARERLVSLGRYAMKGVGRPQELFTPDPEYPRKPVSEV